MNTIVLPTVRPERSAEGAKSKEALAYLQKTVRGRQNVFAALMEAMKAYSLAQISHALYDVGRAYRRNM
jgi:methylmalonyl-CoA mutase